MTMKKILLSFLALGGLLFASSCQMNEPDAGTLTGEVDFTITAGIPGGITTYSPTDGKAFSHLGGINNVSGDYVLRFILEVYDGNAVAYEETRYLDDFSKPQVTFNPRLLAKEYDFVFWADFVEKGDSEENRGDLYYNTSNGLTTISYKDNVTATVLTTDLVDAYYANENVNLTQSSQSLQVTLQRPFGKIRLLATDAPQNIENQNSNIPVSATIAFTDAKVPTTFNARTGEASEPTISVTGYTFTAVKESSPVVTGHNDLAFAYLLGQTYFFESPSSTAYKMTVTVNNATEQIGYRELTNIPVSANKLTTVIGNFYTNEGNLEVIVEDKFGGGEVLVSAGKWDGTTTADPDIDDDNKTIIISSPDQLAGLAKLVNEGKPYQEYTVTLMTNIDLNGHEWTPIGTGIRKDGGYTDESHSFQGTFDGNGNTIYNLSIKKADPENADQAIGLFGIVDGGTVKNLKFENVDINVPSSEMAAAAVGMLTGGGTVSGIEVVSGSIKAIRGNGAVVGRMTESGTIEECINRAAVSGTGANVGGIVGAAYYTVEGGTMTIDDCHNYGTVSGTAGVVGGIVGLSAANVSNCTNEAAITGNGADVAGIVAEQQNAGSIKGCVNKGDITNSSSAYGTGGIVGWIRYNGATSAYPVKNVIEVSGNTNYGSVQGGNDAGGIVGTVYNLGVIKENYNYAPALNAKTFAAGIVGNAQFTETAVGMTENNLVYVTDNFTTTSLSDIDAPCKDLFVYINQDDAVTEENNTLLINDPEQFSSFATAVNNGNTFSGINVALGSDIDLSGVAWTPIGTSTNAFKGTFDGKGHTINNLEISGLDNSIIAGLFGKLNGTVKDLVINNAKISHVSDGSGGIGVVAGSIFNTGLIKNVTVSNAEITGNRWTGGIVGYMYGSVENCKVSNIELTVTPDNLSYNYDNGDKVGGIVGLSPNDNRGTISGNHAENVTIKGYRDLGGIAGAANASALTGNNASNITITVDQVNGWYGDETANAGIILGRKLDNSTLDGNNTESGENSISKSYLISQESSRTKDGKIDFTPESNSTYIVAEGNYNGIQVYINNHSDNITNVSMIAQNNNVTINGNVMFGTHSNRDRSIPASILFEGFTVEGELKLNISGKVVAKNNTAAQLTVKTFGLTDNQPYTPDITLTGNTIDGTLGTTPQGYGIYIVPNVTGYKLTVEGNTIQKVGSHGFAIQGNGDGYATTTIGEYSIKGNKFESWGLGDKKNRGAVKVWEDVAIAPENLTGSSVNDLSEKAKTFVNHILDQNNNNTFPLQLRDNCCIFEFYGLAFNSL